MMQKVKGGSNRQEQRDDEQATDTGSGAVKIPRLYLHLAGQALFVAGRGKYPMGGRLPQLGGVPSRPFSVARLCALPDTAFLTEIKGTL